MLRLPAARKLTLCAKKQIGRSQVGPWLQSDVLNLRVACQVAKVRQNSHSLRLLLSLLLLLLLRLVLLHEIVKLLTAAAVAAATCGVAPSAASPVRVQPELNCTQKKRHGAHMQPSANRACCHISVIHVWTQQQEQQHGGKAKEVGTTQS